MASHVQGREVASGTLSRPLSAGFSPLGLLLVMVMVLLSGFYLVSGLVSSPWMGASIQTTFGLALNAGVVLALSLLPSRRQLPLFLLTVAFFSFLLRLPAYPLVYAAMICLANIPAVLAFRALAFRCVAAGREMDSVKGLLSLWGCGLTTVVVSAVTATALLSVALAVGWLPAADMPSMGFLFGTRLAAQGCGVFTFTPLMLTLMRRRPGTWSWTVWAEIGSWLTLMIGVSGVTASLRDVPLTPLLLLAAFAGLLLAVLAWVVAIMIAERDAARARAHSELAAQEALTTLRWALLPTQLVSGQDGQDLTIASRYRAANEVGLIGGDWYDRAILPGGGTALIIGDVEGHDLYAASVMGLVRGAVRGFALEGHPPAIILERVSSFLLSAGIDRLVTMAYLQLYPGTTMATVALAGHPAPLVISRVGHVRALDIRSGPILGIEGLTDFTEQTVCLPPDGALVLYTDGLIDFPAAPENQRERLVTLLASASSGTLADLADLLISSAPPYDDAAVLVARIPVGQEGVTQRIFPAQKISASVARGWLADLFGIWGEAGLLPSIGTCDELDVAQLLLTELVSNAIRHSDHSVTVTVRLMTQRLMVDVEDTSERMPIMRDLEDVAVEGRGLRLVDALATEWGVRLVEHGKVVWFQLALPSAAALDTVVNAGTGNAGAGKHSGAMPLVRQVPSRPTALIRRSGSYSR